MKISKLIGYLLKVSNSDTLTVTAIDKQTVYVSVSDGITEATAVIDRAALPMDESWPEKTSIAVPKTQIERAYREDACWGMANGVLKLSQGRWSVSLPADTAKNVEVTPLPAPTKESGMTPPSLYNINTTDAFGSDVWVSFERGRKDKDGKRTPLVGVTSIYTGVLLHGLEAPGNGSFPAKILPAVKPLQDMRIYVESSLVTAIGKFPVASGVGVDVFVTSAVPTHSTAPPLSEVVDMLAAANTKNPAIVKALELREVVKSVTTLLPVEARQLRLTCAAGKKGGSISVSVVAETAKFSETIDATIATATEFLLPTNMFKLCLAGIEMNADTLAHLHHTENLVRIDISQPPKKTEGAKLVGSMILAVAQQED